jgi:hypothetical protein
MTLVESLASQPARRAVAAVPTVSALLITSDSEVFTVPKNFPRLRSRFGQRAALVVGITVGLSTLAAKLPDLGAVQAAEPSAHVVSAASQPLPTDAPRIWWPAAPLCVGGSTPAPTNPPQVISVAADQPLPPPAPLLLAVSDDAKSASNAQPRRAPRAERAQLRLEEADLDLKDPYR